MYPDWKRGSKSGFTCKHNYLYTENTMEFTEKLLELISQFRKITEYKINIQISVNFYILAMNNNH